MEIYILYYIILRYCTCDIHKKPCPTHSPAINSVNCLENALNLGGLEEGMRYGCGIIFLLLLDVSLALFDSTHFAFQTTYLHWHFFFFSFILWWGLFKGYLLEAKHQLCTCAYLCEYVNVWLCVRMCVCVCVNLLSMLYWCPAQFLASRNYFILCFFFLFPLAYPLIHFLYPPA